MLQIQLCITEINVDIYSYIKIENYLNYISQYMCDQINSTLVSIRDFFQKHFTKNITDPKLLDGIVYLRIYIYIFMSKGYALRGLNTGNMDSRLKFKAAGYHAQTLSCMEIANLSAFNSTTKLDLPGLGCITPQSLRHCQGLDYSKLSILRKWLCKCHRWGFQSYR